MVEKGREIRTRLCDHKSNMVRKPNRDNPFNIPPPRGLTKEQKRNEKVNRALERHRVCQEVTGPTRIRIKRKTPNEGE